MTRHKNIILTIFIALTACSSHKADDKHTHSSDTKVVEFDTQKTTSTSNEHESKVQKDYLPIHGELTQKQIDRYYPNILDTIKDRRIINSESVDICTTSEIYVSMLHNTGTFDQMFLCTHNKDFNLLDNYYIGTSTMFDKTSHTIEYKKIGNNRLELHHVDWGYVKKKGEEEIDTLNYKKYVLTVTKTGKIEKK